MASRLWSVLFVCGKNRRRSPTAEHLFANLPGIVTTSAGVDQDADEVLSSELVRAADMIVVMEPRYRTKLQRGFRSSLNGQRVVCVNIPDDFEYMQSELIERLQKAVLPHLVSLRQKPRLSKTR